MATAEQKASRVEFQGVYVGVRVSDGKKHYAYVFLNGPTRKDNPIEDWSIMLPRQTHTHLYQNQIAVGAQPGAIFNLYCDDDDKPTALYTSTAADFVEMWGNEQQVIEWNGFSRSAQAELLQMSKAKREMRQKLDVDALAPFAQTYKHLPARQRSLYLAWIIQEITKI